MHALTTLSLRDWLTTLDENGGTSREILLGGTGHLLLSTAEEEAVANQLRHSVLPDLFGGGAQRPVCILTGLAPGADLLFTEVVRVWLRNAGIPHRVTGLLPLPADELLADWALAEQGAGREVNDSQSNEQGTRIVDTLRACSTLVDLIPPGAGAGSLYTAAFRDEQYRRLGACLAERSEILLAMLRPGTPIRAGGTAEVVDWRRNPEAVPRQYSTRSAGGLAARLRDPSRHLVIVNPEAEVPTPSRGAKKVRSLHSHYTAQAEAARRDGNFLLCYDIAERALTHGAHAPRLHYLLLLSLANVGSTELAIRRYQALGLRGDEEDEDWLALHGRLLKDLALITGAASDYLNSAEAYMAAFERTGGYFPAINAATMFFFGGETRRALSLATLVLALITAAEPKDEFQRYFVHASEAEAALLLGEYPRCQKSLAAANLCARGDVNARNRTRRQIRAIADRQGVVDTFSEILRLPDVILFDGRTLAEDSRESRSLRASADDARGRGAAAYVALRHPADLDFIERLQSQHGRTHIVLAEERAVIIERWRRRLGTSEALRLSHALERADEIVVARGFMVDESEWAERHTQDIARGLAYLHAERLGCGVNGEALAAPAAGENRYSGEPMRARLSEGPSPTGEMAMPVPLAKATPNRRLAGMIFADIVGFRRLGDHELPRFWSVVMVSIANLLSGFGERIRFSNTWGDALHVVTIDATTAAELAIAIQAQFEAVRAAESESLSRIELRLSAHYGPVFVGHDPVERRAMFFGSQLALTARIEPVTPPGMNFVTEIFAAQLMLEAPRRFRLDYAGELALAKRHGRHRLYNLRPVRP